MSDHSLHVGGELKTNKQHIKRIEQITISIQVKIIIWLYVPQTLIQLILIHS